MYINKVEKDKINTTLKKTEPKEEKLTVTQINLNHAKLSSLNLLQNLDNPMKEETKHVICIQEPFKDYNTGKIKNQSKNYKTFHSNKHKHPRAIIQVSKSYEKEVLYHEEKSDRDNCTISIEDPDIPGKRIMITSNYLPGSEQIEDSQINKTIKDTNKVKDGIVICTDSNAHSTAWGNEDTNKRGEDMEMMMATHDLTVNNTDLSPTYYKGDKSSTIDLTITNEHAPRIHNWQILKGQSLSDHEMIQFEINLGKKQKDATEKKMPSRKCNKGHFKAKLAEQIKNTTFPLENTDLTKEPSKEIKKKIDRQADIINKLILTAWTQTPHKKPTFSIKNTKKRWPKEIRNLVIKVAKMHRNAHKPTNKKKKTKPNEDTNKTFKKMKNKLDNLVDNLVFTTAATTAPECNKFHKRIAELIATKRKESYSNVINYIRTRISFAMLKAILVSIHGVRSKNGDTQKNIRKVADVAFGLIPSEESYECR